MPLQIQLGDLANRVVRAFGVRGRVPLSLDEQIVPVAVMEFPSDPPFCDVPHFWGTSLRGTGTAVDRAAVGVRCISGVALVDSIMAGLGSASGQLIVQLNRQQTNNYNDTDQIFTLNHPSAVNAGAGFPRPSMRAIQDAQPGVPGIELWTLTLTTTGQTAVDFAGLCLYPGDELVVVSGSVNVAFEASFRGRWYPNT